MKTIKSTLLLTLFCLFPILSNAQVQPGSDKMAVHYIDVGQGDAALLEFGCGAILIDAGTENKERIPKLIEYLDKFFERRTDINKTLDMVLVTHCHVDHNRALKAIADEYTIKNYIDNGKKRGSGKTNQKWMQNTFPDIHKTYSYEDIIAGGTSGLTNEFIDPVNCSGEDPVITLLSGTFETEPEGWTAEEFKNGNNHSIVVKIEFGEASFLFTGDLDFAGIDTMLKHYGAFTNPQAGNILDIDVYQVGHHGAKNGTNMALLNAMTPDYAIMSMGQYSNLASWSAHQYGHPHINAITVLEQGVVKAKSTPTIEWVGLRGKYRDTNLAYKNFEEMLITKSIYGTGWNGTIIINAMPNGNLELKH